MTPEVARLANLIAGASRILLVTGAGISTQVGIPDYRGPNGVWRTQRPVEFDDFLGHEDRRIEYWRQKVVAARSITQAQPGPVHLAAVRLEREARLEAIVTQNVDGLHTIAGSSPGVVVEVHGTAREVSCLSCGDRGPIEARLEAFEETEAPPRCERCGGLLKPATISFGQPLDPLTLARASQAADRADLVVALGTTLSVYPAAEIPLRAVDRGVPYAIINQGRTEHDSLPNITVRIDAEVGEAFTEAVEDALDR